MADHTLNPLASPSSEAGSDSSEIPARYIPWFPLFAALIAVLNYAIFVAVLVP